MQEQSQASIFSGGGWRSGRCWAVAGMGRFEPIAEDLRLSASLLSFDKPGILETPAASQRRRVVCSLFFSPSSEERHYPRSDPTQAVMVGDHRGLGMPSYHGFPGFLPDAMPSSSPCPCPVVSIAQGWPERPRKSSVGSDRVRHRN